MKKLNYTYIFAAIIIAASFFTGCRSSDQKVEAANAQVEAAEQNLIVAQNIATVESQKAATKEQLKTFKLETELTIKNNEVRIAELKLKMVKPGTALDELYAKRIDTLEMKNRNLNSRFNAYEKSQSDWEKFKFEIKHDLDEIGSTLKELTPKKKN